MGEIARKIEIYNNAFRETCSQLGEQETRGRLAELSGYIRSHMKAGESEPAHLAAARSSTASLRFAHSVGKYRSSHS